MWCEFSNLAKGIIWLRFIAVYEKRLCFIGLSKYRQDNLRDDTPQSILTKFEVFVQWRSGIQTPFTVVMSWFKFFDCFDKCIWMRNVIMFFTNVYLLVEKNFPNCVSKNLKHFCLLKPIFLNTYLLAEKKFSRVHLLPKNIFLSVYGLPKKNFPSVYLQAQKKVS